MTESNLREFGIATRRIAADEFTANVFARCELDRYTTAASALGDVYLAWTASGISAVRPAGDGAGFESWYRERLRRSVVPAVEDDPISAAARAKLGGQDVPVRLDLRACSPFEQRVLQKAAEIGPGNARPYGWVAREMGAPDAIRAVGNALGRNPVPLLIPCHRVIRTDSSVGGYAFGSAAKRALLEGEGLDFDAIAQVTRRGFRYIASGDGTFCLPTCGNVATRIDKPGYSGLHSLEEAHLHGLAPCEDCRPIAA